MDKEKIFCQKQDTSSVGPADSGVSTVSWQVIYTESESTTVAVATPEYDSRSNAEYTQSTGFPLMDDLVNTGAISWSSFIEKFVVTNSFGDNLLTIVSNLVASIKQHENWYATRITPENEAITLRVISDSRGSS